MDRLNQLRAGPEAGAGRGGDATFDTSSPPSEAYMSANESSKYFSLSDSTFDISPIKDVSLASAASDEPDELISNLSPISKKDVLENYTIGKQIEAANILSGGVDIFDDNDNSFDGDELVIDDNVDMDEKSTLDKESQLEETVSETTLVDSPLDVASKDTEVVLQIDGKNVDAIDIGNGLYLYRKAGQEELAAVQIITEDNQQAPSFKFLKVRENVEGNLEVYEEFEIEVSKDPVNEVKPLVKSTSHVPIKDIRKATNESSSNNVAEKKDTPPKEVTSTSTAVVETEDKEPEATELHLNGKMMKFTESRKSPVVGSFTPMTYHSTPNKEGKPLTKTMVDQQLHPSRHSDNVKKTIEVHTDSQKKLATDETKPKSESPAKKNEADNLVTQELSIVNEIEESIEQSENQNKIDLKKDKSVISTSSNADKQAINKERNGGKKITDDQNKIKVDGGTKNKVDTVKPTKVLIDNITQEKVVGSSNTGEVETKDFGKKDNDYVRPTPEDSIGNIKSIPKGNKDSNTDSVKDDDISSSIIEVSKPVVESTKQKSTTIDQVLEKAKEIKENLQCNVKTCEQIPKVATINTKDLLSMNQNKDATKQKESSHSSEAVKEASSNLLDQTLKSFQSIEVLKDTKAPQLHLVEENKSPAASSILTTKNAAKSMKDIEKKEIEITDLLKETESKTVSEAELTNEIAKAEPETEMKPEKIKSTIYENEPNVSKLSVSKETKMKAMSQTEKSDLSDLVDNVIIPKAVSKLEKLHPVPKGTEFKTVSEIEMFNPVVKMPETKTASQTDDKFNQVAKLSEPTTASNTENNQNSEVETTNVLSVEKTLLIDKKIEHIAAPHTNKFIPVPKGIKFKIVSKSGVLNPIEKKLEQTPLLKTDDRISVAKQNEIKTYSKSGVLNLKGNEFKDVSKIDQALPITKGIELKTVSKTVLLHPVSKGNEPKTSNAAKLDSVAYQIPKNKAIIITSNKIIVPSKVESIPNKETIVNQVSSNSEVKPLNNNHSAVPFGKWTEANRQEFLNKFKDIKIPATSNTKQIKNSNDLNRIDVLKKIDSQRSITASAKAQDKSNLKDTVFSSKIAPPKVETKIPVKNEGLKVKPKQVDTKNISKPESTTETVSSTVASSVSTSDVANPEPEERREVNFNELIGKAIVDMLNRPVPMPMTRSPLDEPRQADRDDHVTQTESSIDSQNLNIDQQKLKSDQQKTNIDQPKLKNDQRKLNNDQQKVNIEQKTDEDSSGSLDDIEMKMNELHGIPFVERPLHELPKVHKTYSKSNKDSNKSKGAKKMLPVTSKQNLMVETKVIDLESDEDSIGHEPITGDIDLSKKIESKLPVPVKPHVYDNQTAKETLKKPVITENDFDKFAGRNSISYENCLTVKYDGKETANVVKSVKEKDATKNYAKNEIGLMDAKTKLPPKQTTSQVTANKIPNTKFGALPEDPNDKNYVSKIHSAYQSALTAKQQKDRPITIIEDKPVKVVFMDTNSEFVPNQLNVQGKELSPAKKVNVESTKVNPQPVHDVTDAVEEKQQDDTKTKTKHQRKQVLNPVEAPEFELIQPSDLGLDVSPKKKRKTEDNETENSPKNLVHKKSYLLGRAMPDEKTVTVPDDGANPIRETINRSDIVPERSAVSAIDSLVKAAELLENQSVQNASLNPDSQQNTPVKRGRGRPRKNPLLEGASFSKVVSPSPQKKLRLIDAKPVKQDLIFEEESSDVEQMIRENWTMGKINENIVCPICNKLFRSENVVFKHVKHCTGVSPTRSDLEKRSPRIRGNSKESDNKSEDMEFDEKPKSAKSTPKKRKSKESVNKSDETRSDLEKRSPRRRRYSIESDNKSEDMEFDRKPKSAKSTSKKRKSKESVNKSDEVDIIVIEETPVKEQETVKEPRSSKTSEEKQERSNIVKANNTTTDETEEKPKKLVGKKLVKEQTLKEIAEEQLKAKQLKANTEEDSDKEKNMGETTEEKPERSKKLLKTSIQRSSNLICEFCGKAFRQLSYLANHKLQHKKEQLKKLEAKLTAKLQVFSCEVCKKEFRKLHHLVQHRVIHNPEVPTRTTRKSSSEQSDAKVKESPLPKQNDDTSAGFRCEPCDKSFRKLHHLVEHRETHDGINRQKTNQTPAQPIEKPPPPPQCDVCKKSFRKLHLLIEHKELHHVEQVETSSEKSDDKSVQSSLSTRDIIHECSLCYMVFPNEHSLNKHFVICQQKKKRQSKAKDKPDNADGTDTVEENTNTEDSMDAEDAPKIVEQQIIGDDKVESEQKSKNIALPEKIEQKRVSEEATHIETTLLAEKRIDITDILVPKEKIVTEVKSTPVKRDHAKSNSSNAETIVPEKIKKIDDLVKAELSKKTSAKDKVPPSVNKTQKTIVPLPALPEGKQVESSDDDEIRYMLNPNFKVDETSEGKVFMKVRSNKRNSLQIERPISRDLVNRRTSLQHPPKIPRLKAKAVEPKVLPTKNAPKAKLQASTDSDENDVKYAFPETVSEQTSKVETPKEKKALRKSMAEKRKSLSGIAKRKSLGQGIAKLKVNPSPVRIIKRRTLDVEHRCDCGQLFNSAALLTRHTSLAHTPPRIRRRRSPPPEANTNAKQRKSTIDTQLAKTTRKSSVKSEASNSKPTRKSSAKSDTPETRKSTKPEQSLEKRSSAKPRKNAAHRGVPVPEKMRKLMLKNTK